MGLPLVTGANVRPFFSNPLAVVDAKDYYKVVSIRSGFQGFNSPLVYTCQYVLSTASNYVHSPRVLSAACLKQARDYVLAGVKITLLGISVGLLCFAGVKR